jgi:hypothetical protein
VATVGKGNAMTDTQYRAKTNGANLRTDPSVKAHIVTTVSPGSILHLDPERTADVDKDGRHWLPVLYVSGWVRDDVVEVVKPSW